MDGNREIKYTIESRMNVFQKAQRELREIMFGQWKEIWPYMQSRGKYSEQKTMKLVKEIVTEGNSDLQEDFYTSLLYCLLRVYTTEFTVYKDGNTIGVGEETASFAHMLSGIQDQKNPKNSITFEGITLLILTELYVAIAGKRLQYEDVLWEKDELSEMGKEILAEEELQDWESDSYLEEMLVEWKKAFKIEVERIRNEFPSQKQFCKNLQNVVKYIKENKVEGDVKRVLEDKINQFLLEQGEAMFNKEEEFYETVIYIKRGIRCARKYTRC